MKMYELFKFTNFSLAAVQVDRIRVAPILIFASLVAGFASAQNLSTYVLTILQMSEAKWSNCRPDAFG